ncbi:MAG TPA: NAD(P)-dependent oxidoreductase [Peptococcaceae bacterium]|nr:NAD(P)-dependent oxidoreductase [Peptococcaceae bacterium]
MKLGFIGLGKMGKPMAKNLLQAGHELVVYNRSMPAVQELQGLGAKAASSPAEVGKEVEVVFLCLPVGRDVELTLTGEKGLLQTLREGTYIVDHSTISPKDSQRMFNLCREKGIGFLDAPISGGVAGAEKGTLSIMVGGEKAHFEKVKPLLGILGKNIFYLGPSGSGNVMKLVNNLLVGITNAALAEAFVLAQKNGLDPKQVFDILVGATGDSFMLRRNLPNFVLKRDFTPTFTLDMLNKDMGLAEELALDQGVRLLLGSLAHQIGREAAVSGFGSEDMSAVIKVLERLSGVEVGG